MKHYFLLILSLIYLVLLPSCNGQSEPKFHPAYSPVPCQSPNFVYAPDYICQRQHDTTRPVNEYIRRIFQDKKGNIWLGTNNDGVYRFDGTLLTYFSTHQGLGGNQVTGILEDRHGKLWFATNGGVSCYQDGHFMNFTDRDGLSDNHVWSILEDRKGIIWVGTEKGVCRFDGKLFVPFDLPPADLSKPVTHRYSLKLARCLLEDRQGNIWFGMDGTGVLRYDGKNFTRFLAQDGLAGNNVVGMLEDQKGNIWFASYGFNNEKEGGVSRFDGQKFTPYHTTDRVSSPNVWTVYQDKNGVLWFAGAGLDKSDGKTIVESGLKEGLGNLAINSILEDQKGRFWVGTAGGLYRFNGTRFVQIRKDGPWE